MQVAVDQQPGGACTVVGDPARVLMAPVSLVYKLWVEGHPAKRTAQLVLSAELQQDASRALHLGESGWWNEHGPARDALREAREHAHPVLAETPGGRARHHVGGGGFQRRASDTPARRRGARDHRSGLQRARRVDSVRRQTREAAL